MLVLSDVQLAWLAGLIEADGHIGIHVRKNNTERYKIAVEMADEDVVTYCHKMTGVGTMLRYDRKPGKWKPTFKWQVQSTKDVVKVLKAIKPFVVSARKKAELQRVLDGCNPILK